MRYVLIVLLISGCVSAEQRAERRNQVIANAADACDKMGFKRGSPEHSNCQLELVKTAAQPGPSVSIPSAGAKTCVPIGGGGVSCY